MKRSKRIPEKPIVINVNTDCENEATVGESIDDLAASLGDVTWRELLEECLHENVDSHKDDLEDWLEFDYGITPEDLDEIIPSAMVDRYYTQLCYRQDNMTGSNVEVFDLIRSLDIVPTDVDGNGSVNGITLVQTTANGPRKYVYIEDRKSASWLEMQAAESGVSLKVRFI